jgi:hypothetical protein
MVNSSNTPIDTVSSYNSTGNFTVTYGNGGGLSGSPVTAYRSSAGGLWTATPAGASYLGQSVMAGTSPSVAALPGGGFEGAFQASSGLLEIFGSSIYFDTQLGMKAGTSPSIAVESNGTFEVAFQANTGILYDFTLASGGVSQGYAMAAGTSPSITALASGGFETAFQASTGLLWEVGSYINFNTELGMKAGTSPSIAALPSVEFDVAFQANTGYLYIQNLATGGINQGYVLASGTSPSITALASGGYEAAFQASTGLLWEVGSYINFNTELGMLSGTSPSIAAMPSVQFDVAFQANTGYLYIQNLATGGINQGYVLASGTSPSITA